MRESEVRAQVSGARSEPNCPGLMSSAVRQTPLTETLSPALSSFGALPAATVMRRFSFICSMRFTRPTSSTMPVNMSYLRNHYFNSRQKTRLGIRERLSDSASEQEQEIRDVLLCDLSVLCRENLVRIWIAKIAFHCEIVFETMKAHMVDLRESVRGGGSGICRKRDRARVAKNPCSVIQKDFVDHIRRERSRIDRRSAFDHQRNDFKLAETAKNGSHIEVRARLTGGELLDSNAELFELFLLRLIILRTRVLYRSR